ncbi:hypothetical protein [Egicoccus sp. AB-alg6-2]|uniref:hypothetical protein n=1 Tax=Egicoccus sp. AB-alg6-2 TaxID=3242692 RepID=UPI00359D5B9C
MLYLVATPGQQLAAGTEGPWTEVRPVEAGLAFVDSDQHRSAVYHAVKDALPAGAPLLVAEVHEVPKCRGLAPGALAWARARLPR